MPLHALLRCRDLAFLLLLPGVKSTRLRPQFNPSTLLLLLLRCSRRNCRSLLPLHTGRLLRFCVLQLD